MGIGSFTFKYTNISGGGLFSAYSNSGNAELGAISSNTFADDFSLTGTELDVNFKDNSIINMELNTTNTTTPIIKATNIKVDSNSTLKLSGSIAGSNNLPTTNNILANGTSYALMEAINPITGNFTNNIFEIKQGKYLTYDFATTKSWMLIQTSIFMVGMAMAMAMASKILQVT